MTGQVRMSVRKRQQLCSELIQNGCDCECDPGSEESCVSVRGELKTNTRRRGALMKT